MRTQFTVLLFVIFSAFSFGQTFYNLEIVAEGSFGSTNADVFNVTNTTTPTSTSAGLYQTANSTTGFDVLQDFGVFGNKALMIEKPAGPGRIVIVDYPAFTEVQTFSTTDAPQTLVMASETKGYVSTSNPASIQFVDLQNLSVTAVNDPNGDISSVSYYMIQADGEIYAALGSKIVKVDTLNQTVSGVVNPGIGSIKGMVFDEQTNLVWVMNGSGSLISVDVLNSDVLGTEILTGVSGTSFLRTYDSNLYFWKKSTKDLFIYNTVSPSLPLASVYTSSLGGAFGYGRSFDIDPNTGDFAICSAGGYVAPSLFEVVDGTAFTLIESGEAAGVAIANKLRLSTFPATLPVPVPDLASLPTINEECEVTLTAPTADGGTVTATTNDPLTYSSQGTYTVTWTYENSNGTSTQTQEVVIEDVTAPVVNIETLPALGIECNETISNFPLATDNCVGTIIGTTTDSLAYDTEGTYTITWIYADAVGNETEQVQTIEVTCSTTGLTDYATNNVNLYPNPATDVLNIDTDEVSFVGQLMNTQGQVVLKFNEAQTIQVGHLPKGVYYLQMSNLAIGTITEKVVIQ